MRGFRVALFLLALLPLILLAAAQAEARCRQFSWAVGKRIDLFTEGFLPTVDSAQSLPRDGVFGLRLRRAPDVVYPVPPERGSDTGYGGIVTIERIAAGRWQIALTEEAWLDAVQEHKRVPLVSNERTPACPGVRQIVELDVAGEPLTLQIGGLSVDRLAIGVLRVWNFGGRER